MYVFNTWVVANLFHPVIVMIAGMIAGDFNANEFVSITMLVFVISLAGSLPSLLISWVLMILIRRLPFDNTKTFLSWLFLISSLPMINFLFFFFFVKERPDIIEVFFIALPATISVILAVLIRMKQFFRLINHTQNISHETNLV